MNGNSERKKENNFVGLDNKVLLLIFIHIFSKFTFYKKANFLKKIYIYCYL